MMYLNPKYLLIFLIKAYKFLISPILPPACRHYPSCSEYATQALQKHGFFKGTYLGTVRILKCNPLFKGGYDPVP
jgi:putative membrane protein insertion efficiency factor